MEQTYQLTQAAASDLQGIVEWGIDHFGIDRAEDYAEGLLAHMNIIGEHPMRFQSVDEIRSGYRRSVYQSHSVYYTQTDKLVLIVRILGRQSTSTL